MRLVMDARVRRGHFSGHYLVDEDIGILGVYGASGSGKTTLFHLLAGLVPQDEGRLMLDDAVLCDTVRRIMVPAHCRHIGVVFQEPRLFPHCTVRKNLLFGVPRGAADEAFFNEVVTLLDIGDLLDTAATRVSGGEAQRVAIGRALLAKPRMLLLDEPFSALDAVRRAAILGYIHRIRERLRLPILLVSHRIEDILFLTDRILLIRDGTVAAAGLYREVLLRHADEPLFAGMTAANVLHRTVTAVHAADGMALLSRQDHPDEAPIIAPAGDGLRPGMTVCASVDACDISLSLSPIECITTRNQLPGIVRSVRQAGTKSLLCIDAGDLFVVETTHSSVSDFELWPGRRVWLFFKAHSVRVTPEYPALGKGALHVHCDPDGDTGRRRAGVGICSPSCGL